jgi:two-component system response regulator YesN
MGEAPDGAKALELMADGPPDILLTDIVMPHMNGLELIEKVKERYPGTLIIVLSSHNEFEYVRQAMKMGVEDYLLKTSLRPAELLQLLIEAKGKLQRNGKKRSEHHAQSEVSDNSSDAMNRLLASSLKNEETDELAERDNSLPDHSYLLLLHMRGIRDGVPHHSAAGLLKHLVEAELQGLLHAGPIQTGEREMAAILNASGWDRERLQARIDSLTQASGSLLGISLSGYWSGPIGRRAKQAGEWPSCGKRRAPLKRKKPAGTI